MNTGELGAKAENSVARHYRRHGYRILAQNFRTRQGELDIVAQKGQQIAIIEVKARSHTAGYAPCEAVDAAKQRRIVLASLRFLQQYGLSENPIRFDVVEVTKKGLRTQIRCIENAFTV